MSLKQAILADSKGTLTVSLIPEKSGTKSRQPVQPLLTWPR